MTFHVTTIRAIMMQCGASSTLVTDALNNVLATQEAMDVHEAARHELNKNYRDSMIKIDSRIAELRAHCSYCDRGGGCICSVCGAT